MYNWLVLLHVFFAFAFMLVHGVHAAQHCMQPTRVPLRYAPDVYR